MEDYCTDEDLRHRMRRFRTARPTDDCRVSPSTWRWSCLDGLAYTWNVGVQATQPVNLPVVGSYVTEASLRRARYSSLSKTVGEGKEKKFRVFEVYVTGVWLEDGGL